jgi:flagellar basal-body rod protein FlgB
VGPQVFSGDTFGALGRALDAASLRQETIAGNLANVNTPGYRRKDVAAFAAELGDQAGRRLALRQTRARHLNTDGTAGGGVPGTPPVVVTDGRNGGMRLDGNNVDPDAEAARLAEAEITYTALTRALSEQFAALRVAINGAPR